MTCHRSRVGKGERESSANARRPVRWKENEAFSREGHCGAAMRVRRDCRTAARFVSSLLRKNARWISTRDVGKTKLTFLAHDGEVVTSRGRLNAAVSRAHDLDASPARAPFGSADEDVVQSSRARVRHASRPWTRPRVSSTILPGCWVQS